MANFLITGGTGFIGSTLLPQLVNAGHKAVVITRNPEKHRNRFGDSVRFAGRFSEIDNHEVFTAVINLGGEGIGDKRWSDARKQELFSSRIGLTEHLVKLLERLQTRPEVMISGSAIGWYGAQDERALNENASPHVEFTHELCRDWEEAAKPVTDLGIRLCIIRLGLVLGESGGVLKRLLPPFRFGLGGPMGSGQQIMSWVHIDDVIKALNFLINDPSLSGVFNLTTPGAVSNAEFARTLGQVLSRPAVLPLPGFVVKTVFGEMGERLLLKGQNVVPSRLLDNGYTFDFPGLHEALTDILKS